MVINNPFRFRATEQLRQVARFHTTFGVEMLNVLPAGDELWNRLIVFRSAPGAGKTSLLKLFSAESLAHLSAYVHPEPSVELLRRGVTERGALTAKGVRRLGLFLSLRPDYKTLVDLGPTGAGASKVLFKLLDSRIMRATIEAVAAAAQVPFPEALNRISLNVRASGANGQGALNRLMGLPASTQAGYEVTADDVLRRAQGIEADVLELLDSLVPVNWDEIDGHTRLYCLDVLGDIEIRVDGQEVPFEPFLLIDDVDELHPDQREAIYTALLSRNVKIGRWIAERQAAVPARELLGQTVGRDVIVVTVDDSKLVSDSKRHKLLKHIADARGVVGLRAIDVHSPFTDLLDGDASLDQRKLEDAVVGSRTQVANFVDSHPAYRSWLQAADKRASVSNNLEAAIAYRETLIRLERERSRSVDTLFDVDYDDSVEVEEGSEPQSKDRVAAKLFLSREFQLPYYYGSEVFSALSSRNVEQYLRVAGDAFDAMLAVTARRSRMRNAVLSAADQDRLIRKSSMAFWSSIPARVEHGPDVLALLTSIAAVCVEQTYRSNAPYAPGVTGTAIPYLQRNALFESSGSSTALTSRLRNALASAVADNLIEMSGEIVRVKNQDLIQLHLNRLLLPALRLPLQRSGFREQSVSVLARRLEAVGRMKLDASRAMALQPADVSGWPK